LNVQTNTDGHGVTATAYLAAAAEPARQAYGYEGENGKRDYAQVLATVAVGEALLAVVQAIHEASAV
jgi:hypothetical protein